MYIECLENCDKSQVIHPDLKLTMGLGSRVINSYVSGNLSLERYACINRVTCRQYNGLGNFSYISRSSVGRYCSMGARISVGAFQHPLDWLSISGMQFRSDSFADALTEIHAVPEIQNKTATNEEYITIYNKIMLNPIFDSHPIGFIWR